MNQIVFLGKQIFVPFGADTILVALCNDNRYRLVEANPDRDIVFCFNCMKFHQLIRDKNGNVELSVPIDTEW